MEDDDDDSHARAMRVHLAAIPSTETTKTFEEESRYLDALAATMSGITNASSSSSDVSEAALNSLGKAPSMDEIVADMSVDSSSVEKKKKKKSSNNKQASRSSTTTSSVSTTTGTSSKASSRKGRRSPPPTGRQRDDRRRGTSVTAATSFDNMSVFSGNSDLSAGSGAPSNQSLGASQLSAEQADRAWNMCGCNSSRYEADNTPFRNKSKPDARGPSSTSRGKTSSRANSRNNTPSIPETQEGTTMDTIPNADSSLSTFSASPSILATLYSDISMDEEQKREAERKAIEKLMKLADKRGVTKQEDSQAEQEDDAAAPETKTLKQEEGDAISPTQDVVTQAPEANKLKPSKEVLKKERSFKKKLLQAQRDDEADGAAATTVAYMGNMPPPRHDSESSSSDIFPGSSNSSNGKQGSFVANKLGSSKRRLSKRKSGSSSSSISSSRNSNSNSPTATASGRSSRSSNGSNGSAATAVSNKVHVIEELKDEDSSDEFESSNRSSEVGSSMLLPVVSKGLGMVNDDGDKSTKCAGLEYGNSSRTRDVMDVQSESESTKSKKPDEEAEGNNRIESHEVTKEESEKVVRESDDASLNKVEEDELVVLQESTTFEEADKESMFGSFFDAINPFRCGPKHNGRSTTAGERSVLLYEDGVDEALNVEVLNDKHNNTRIGVFTCQTKGKKAPTKKDDLKDESMQDGSSKASSSKSSEDDGPKYSGMKIRSKIIYRTKVVPAVEALADPGKEGIIVVDSISVKIEEIAQKITRRNARVANKDRNFHSASSKKISTLRQKLLRMKTVRKVKQQQRQCKKRAILDRAEAVTGVEDPERVLRLRLAAVQATVRAGFDP